MNITHNSMVIHSCAKYSMTMSKLWPEHEAIYIYIYICVKNAIFDLEVNNQSGIRIISVQDTSSDGEKPTCQI